MECEIEGIGVLRNIVVEHLEESNGKGELCQEAEAASSVEKDVPSATDDSSKLTNAVSTGPPIVALSAVSSTQLPPKQRLQNSVCIVTGGARGIGYGIALRLAIEGAKLVALIDMKQDDLDAAVTQLKQEVQQVFDAEGLPAVSSSAPLFCGLACDVTNTDQVAETFRKIATQLSPTQRIDILVQSAGVVGQTNILTHQVEPTNFDYVMNVNVRGIFNGCQAVLPYMLQQNYGRIINIASIAGKEGNAGMLAYSTSKAAVIGLTKTVGKEYALNGITCNAIAPAVIRTKMVADMPLEQVKYMTDKIPMKRCGKVEEIAALVAFVASEEAGFTTGFCFDATGGRSVY